MKRGEKFETQCFKYLEERYKTPNTTFYHEGGMDSTKSDIAVLKRGEVAFFIEAKDAEAQSGQFVLLPDEVSKTFVFSPRNKSNPNKVTDIIIDYMNGDFYRFYNAGTTGATLDIDAQFFAEWIIEHYTEKNVRYVISYGSDYVILPIRKFGEYFNISAEYRIKKSGSRTPAKKDVETVVQTIKTRYKTTQFAQEEEHLYVKLAEPLAEDKFVLGKYTYYLSGQGANEYEIRRLSNTQNMNVIFSIELIKDQDNEDLEEFKADL